MQLSTRTTATIIKIKAKILFKKSLLPFFFHKEKRHFSSVYLYIYGGEGREREREFIVFSPFFIGHKKYPWALITVASGGDRGELLLYYKVITKESADPEHLGCLFRIQLIKMDIKKSIDICQNGSSRWKYECIVFTVPFSRQAFFSFASRFKLGAVEKCAKSVSTFLKEKQERERPPNADKEAYDMANKLRKVKKSIEKQKIM